MLLVQSKGACHDFCLFFLQFYELNILYSPFNQDPISGYDHPITHLFLIRGVLLSAGNIQAIRHCGSIWAHLSKLVSFNWLASVCLQTLRPTPAQVQKEKNEQSPRHVLHGQKKNEQILFNAFYPIN